MPAAAVARADLAGRLALLAQQRVDQGRLAGPGRAQQHRRAPGDSERPQHGDAVAAPGADGHGIGDPQLARQAGCRAIRIGIEIGLGEHQRRRHAIGPRERGQALDCRGLGSGSAEVSSARSTFAART